MIDSSWMCTTLGSIHLLEIDTCDNHHWYRMRCSTHNLKTKGPKKIVGTLGKQLIRAFLATQVLLFTNNSGVQCWLGDSKFVHLGATFLQFLQRPMIHPGGCAPLSETTHPCLVLVGYQHLSRTFLHSHCCWYTSHLYLSLSLGFSFCVWCFPGFNSNFCWNTQC
jgi:hypothetical protein